LTSLVCRVFPVPVQAVEQLYELYERELVTGKMFVCTPVRVPVGERVVLRIQHPHSRDSFDLHGLVESIHPDPSYPGLNLALRPSTMARRERFKEFITRGAPGNDVGLEE
jgi:Tfp pilus assembly protein PilZ